jgi:hypothetical protein
MKKERINWQEEVEPGLTRSQFLRDVCIEEIETHGYAGYKVRSIKRLGLEDTAAAVENFIQRAPWKHELREHDPLLKFVSRAGATGDKRIRYALEAEIKAAAREKSIGDKLQQTIRKVVPSLPVLKRTWRPPKRKEEGPFETAVQFLSDWHAYEYVSAERTRGLNEYTPEIMCQRAGQLVASHTSIHQKLSRGGYRFPELVLMLGGDFAPGTIHDLERHAYGTNITQAVMGCAWLLAQVIRSLSQLYETVYIVGVGGNHGRLPDAKRKQMKDPQRTWDWIIYQMVSWMLHDQKNLKFWFPDAWAAQVEIRGWNFLLNHGDDIKSWGGIPWYGIQRRTDKTLALEGGRGNVIHYQMLAHFHASTNIPHPAGETFVNGSMIGGTEFSVDSLGSSDPPKQLMLMVHEKRGVTSRWPLRLDILSDDRPDFVTTDWVTGHEQPPVGMGTIPKLIVGS